MFKHYFEKIEGIDIYPIISLLIFFIFFVLLFIWVLKVDKQYIKDMEDLPLDRTQSNEKEQ
jgi:cytochrome c oxidase cbb3-type subunit 4